MDQHWQVVDADFTNIPLPMIGRLATTMDHEASHRWDETFFPPMTEEGKTLSNPRLLASHQMMAFKKPALLSRIPRNRCKVVTPKRAPRRVAAVLRRVTEA